MIEAAVRSEQSFLWPKTNAYPQALRSELAKKLISNQFHLRGNSEQLCWIAHKRAFRVRELLAFKIPDDHSLSIHLLKQTNAAICVLHQPSPEFD